MCLNAHEISILQGFCSGNDTILPNHWINEGPGPPVCPPSCVKLPNSEFFGKANSHLNMRDKRIFYEKQQCLEYLNDNKESSPEQICRKQPRDILNALHVLRLRSCCEKSISSSLHNEAMLSVLDGGEECVKILKQLIDTDGIASRITCGLNEILFRYDCRQIYSIKHGCNDCKVNFRNRIVIFFLMIRKYFVYSIIILLIFTVQKQVQSSHFVCTLDSFINPQIIQYPHCVMLRPVYSMSRLFSSLHQGAHLIDDIFCVVVLLFVLSCCTFHAEDQYVRSSFLRCQASIDVFSSLILISLFLYLSLCLSDAFCLARDSV